MIRLWKQQNLLLKTGQSTRNLCKHFVLLSNANANGRQGWKYLKSPFSEPNKKEEIIEDKKLDDYINEEIDALFDD